MKKPTKCRTGVLSQSRASIFAARPIRSKSNFALGERRIKKNFRLLQQISIKKNCPLYYIVIVNVDEQFAAYALKIYIYNCRKDEELARLLRSYAKQISINAMKKNGAPLLGLAECILKLAQALLPTRRGSTVIIVDASFGIQTNNQKNNQTTLIRFSADLYLYINS